MQPTSDYYNEFGRKNDETNAAPISLSFKMQKPSEFAYSTVHSEVSRQLLTARLNAFKKHNYNINN
jgi:hypothetical protein